MHRDNNNIWEKLYVYNENKNSVNFLSFNHNTNDNNSLQLVVGYNNGILTFISFNETNGWNTQLINAHAYGVTSVCWMNSQQYSKNSSFVTGGNDSNMKLYEIRSDSNEKVIEISILEKIHVSSIIGIHLFNQNNKQFIASYDNDDEIYVWTVSQNDHFNFESPSPMKFVQDQKPVGITHLTWSKCGNILSVSTSESVFLYKYIEGEWCLYSSMNSEGVFDNYEEAINN